MEHDTVEDLAGSEHILPYPAKDVER